MTAAAHPADRHIAGAGSRLSGWIRLALGLGAIWLLAFVVLPWGAGLGPVRPVMEVLAASGAEATQYFYTQSEETARAQMYVRNTLSSTRSDARRGPQPAGTASPASPSRSGQ